MCGFDGVPGVSRGPVLGREFGITDCLGRKNERKEKVKGS